MYLIFKYYIIITIVLNNEIKPILYPISELHRSTRTMNREPSQPEIQIIFINLYAIKFKNNYRKYFLIIDYLTFRIYMFVVLFTHITVPVVKCHAAYCYPQENTNEIHQRICQLSESLFWKYNYSTVYAFAYYAFEFNSNKLTFYDL